MKNFLIPPMRISRTYEKVENIKGNLSILGTDILSSQDTTQPRLTPLAPTDVDGLFLG
jgi:hypothetical protein